jgi:hypothetical protein
MMTDMDRSASDGMSVAPEGDEASLAQDPRQDAGQDKSIAKRLEKNPGSKQAQLDNALDESMDASDPPSTTQPARNEPAPSSGFDEAAEAAR